MQFKRILAGVLSAAMVVTGVPAAGGADNVSLAEEAKEYVYLRYTSDDTWNVDTDAGTATGSDVNNVLKEDSMWLSANAGTESGPRAGTGFIKNNRMYVILKTPAKIKKIDLLAEDPNGSGDGKYNGKITQAKIYFAYSDEVTEIPEGGPKEIAADKWHLAAENKEELADGNTSDWTTLKYGDGEDETDRVAYDTSLDRTKDVKIVCIEALHSAGNPANDYIALQEAMLYGEDGEQIKNTAEQPDTLTAAADMPGHDETAESGKHLTIDKIVDGDNTTKFHTLWKNDANEQTEAGFPIKEGFVERNNFYFTLPEAINIGRLTYVAGQKMGCIMDANIYVSNKTLEEGQTAKDIGTAPENISDDATQGWKKVYSGDREWTTYSENSETNNGHSESWEPVEAKYVRIEVEHTYGSNNQDRNTCINMKRIILYSADEAKDVALPASKGGKAKIVACSGYMSEQESTSNNADKVIDADDTSSWKAGPALKNGQTANEGSENYVVIDLGENTRTLLSSLQIKWNSKAYATNYKIETSDVFTPKSVTASADTNWSSAIIDPADTTEWIEVRSASNEEKDEEHLEDKLTFDGVRPDNSYAEAAACELKRYVRLVATSMNKYATENGISIREIVLTGAQRTVNKLSEAVLTVNTPAAGQSPAVPGREGNTFTVTNAKWTLADGQTFTGTFQAATSYKLSARLKVGSEDIFTKDTVVKLKDGDTEYTVTAENKTINPDDSMDISYIFEVPANPVESAALTVTAPASGDAPANVTAATGANYTVATTWKDAQNNAVTTFEGGKTYTMTAVLTPKSGYEFTQKGETSVTLKDSAGNDIVVKSKTFDETAGTLTVTAEFAIPEDAEIASVNLSVTAPKINETPADVSTADTDYTVQSTAWSPEAAKFAPETAYTVTVTLQAAKAHKFTANTAVVLKDGDKTYEATKEAGADGKTLTVAYTFESTPADTVAGQEDKNALQAEMDKAKDLHELDYTPESWEALQNAIAAADALMKDGNATKSAVDNAKEAVQNAIASLEERSQEDKVDAMVAQVLDMSKEMEEDLTPNKSNYDNVTFNKYVNAYNKAIDVYNKYVNGEITAEEFASQFPALLEAAQSARNGLVTVEAAAQAAAKKNLADMLTEAKKTLDAGKGACPDAVWSAFQNAYNAANQGKNGTDTATLTKLYNDLKTALANVNAQKNMPKAGAQYTVGKLVYQVKTSTATDKTVIVVKPVKKTNKSLTIPATVNISGQPYKVVEIKANAFAKNKKLASVKIGANVTKIGQKAFFGCRKLKKVTIKAGKLKTIGKNAFAKINKKAKIKVPKKQLKALKKKLKKAKTIKSAKITK